MKLFVKIVFFSSFFLQCITNASRQLGIDSSLDMPDKVLNFVKDHFLMDRPVKSQPVLFTHSVHYTQIAVHHVQGLHRAYDVMFIGTGMFCFLSVLFSLISISFLISC